MTATSDLYGDRAVCPGEDTCDGLLHCSNAAGDEWLARCPTHPRRADRPGYVYVASSWRNPLHTAVCAALRTVGIDHYDFRNPAPGEHGFSWRDVEPDGMDPTERTPLPKGQDLVPVERYLQMLDHPIAAAGYELDFAAMERADTFVLVLPCGRSAHLELGWAVGAGKRTAILLEDPAEPELMYRMVDYLAPSLIDLLAWLGVDD